MVNKGTPSEMVELVWTGKYKDGRKIAPVNIDLPFQTIETVNESAQQRQLTLEQFATGKPTKWRNRLIWGDKKYILPSLLPEFAGKVNLIYIDPPFDTGADFSFTTTIPDGDGDEIVLAKEPSIIEQKAYRDTWGVNVDERRQGLSSLDKYTQWFYETIIFLRELLTEDGSIYVHLDWHAGHYAKCILDEVFGYENFRNEINCKRIRKNIQEYKTVKRLNVALDSILFYSKSENHRLVAPRTNMSMGERWHAFDAPEIRNGMDYLLFGKRPPQGRHWMWEKERAEQAIKQGLLKENAKTGKPEYKVISESPILTTLWDDIPGYSFQYGFDTEKNEQLLERIIRASSNEGDLVLDCFVGSGTTAAVAEKLNRRWIACDLSRFAIHTTRKRLLGISAVKPFVVQNLGKYERQLWMQAEFESMETRSTQEKAYRNFILKLYHAESLKGYAWLHGVKQGRMIHVGAVDSPVAMGDVKSIVQEFWKLVGTSKEAKINGLDIVGWEFAFEINETAKQFAASNNIDLKFKKIPREVLDKRAVEAGDIQFFELGALDVKVTVKGKSVTLSLDNFTIPPDDVPEEARKAISHWSQFVDYWALDWHFRDDTFHNEWQTYRTKKDPKIQLSVSHTYSVAGKYRIMIKVMDILGNDTTKVIQVEIP